MGSGPRGGSDFFCQVGDRGGDWGVRGGTLQGERGSQGGDKNFLRGGPDPDSEAEGGGSVPPVPPPPVLTYDYRLILDWTLKILQFFEDKANCCQTKNKTRLHLLRSH